MHRQLATLTKPLRLIAPVRSSQPTLSSSFRRFYFEKETPWRQVTTPHSSVLVEENFAKHSLFVLDVARRGIKFSLLGLLTLVTTAAVGYEGLHLWIEHKELAPEKDPEVLKWQWDSTIQRWSGDALKGGTDPGLGFKGRHIVRSAWMAQNFGVGFSTAVVGGEATTNNEEGLPGPAGIKVIDAELQRAEDFLKIAIDLATRNMIDSKLHPGTLSVLLTHHADVLERLGFSFWPAAKAQYEKVWETLPDRGSLEAAQIASKIGDISSRLGEGEAAWSWWARAIYITLEKTATSEPLQNQVPTTAPTSPLAQRILIGTLISQSAFLASSGQLKRAASLEEQALALLRSIGPPVPTVTSTLPQTLHALFLLQRSSILSVHLAEVLHGLRKSASSSIQWLTSAAESSERVASALTGSESQPKPGDLSLIVDGPLLPGYSTSPSMNRSAKGLLRDARRTAAEAWNLIGVLQESHDPRAALECYERALSWAGTPGDKNGTRQLAQGTFHSEWDIYLDNYNRVITHLQPPS